MRENSLNVELRTEKGKGANTRLRQSGYIPAVLYSHGESEMIKIKKQDFFSLFRGNVSESVMIDLNITDKKKDNDHKVFVKAYQQDPVTEELLHVDFYKTTLGERIHTKVPVEIVGKSEGEKMGGILEVVERELEIECLPNEMPEKIEIDVTNINIGDSIHIEDIEIAGSVKFMVDEKRAIVTVVAPKAHIEEEELEELEAEAVEGEEEVLEEQEGEEGEKTEE